MRQVANDIVDTLVKKLPIIISGIDLAKADNKTYNAVRIVRKILKKLNRINQTVYVKERE